MKYIDKHSYCISEGGVIQSIGKSEKIINNQRRI